MIYNGTSVPYITYKDIGLVLSNVVVDTLTGCKMHMFVLKIENTTHSNGVTKN